MNNIVKQVDYYLDLLEECAVKNPAICVISGHDYFRNLYPSDKFHKNWIPDPVDRISQTLEVNISLLQSAKHLDSYEIDFNQNFGDPVEKNTGKVYRVLWKEFNDRDISEAATLLSERFTLNNLDIKSIIHGDALDAGCGSGRYTFALKSLGANSVLGLDAGDFHLAQNNKISGVNFEYANLLSLKNYNNQYDFVLSNGVAHHTSDLYLALDGIFHVTKPGGYIFLYLYGSGGVFWNSRKRMNQIFKKIDQMFTRNLLKTIGLPTNRFIFEDNWYVPIETHSKHEDLANFFKKRKLKYWQRLSCGLDTDLPTPKTNELEWLYGEGELRYLIQK